jgi:hypothetical protein
VALYDIVSSMRPMTVRQAFYQATVAGLVEKTEQGYSKVQVDLTVISRGHRPWGHRMSHHRNRNALKTVPRPIPMPPLPIADSIMAADPPTLPSQPNSLRHQPLAGLFPLMQAAEFERFRAALQSDGRPLEEIVLLDGMIIDGRNRQRACDETGIAPRYREFDGEDGDPLGFVIAKNLSRRPLQFASFEVPARFVMRR